MTTDRFPVKLNLRVDWSEMDLFGHVNNVMFFKYIQSSRVNFWDHVDLMARFEETKIGPILASCSCDFKKPIHYPGNILLQVRLEFIKTTSFGLHHQILNEENELAAEAHDAIVWYDFNKNEKSPITDDMRLRFESL